MKVPTVWKLRDLVRLAKASTDTPSEHWLWMPKRPEFAYPKWHRLRCAYLVFTGKADAVIWPGGQ